MPSPCVVCRRRDLYRAFLNRIHLHTTLHITLHTTLHTSESPKVSVAHFCETGVNSSLTCATIPV